jgi:hypothetical protein
MEVGAKIRRISRNGKKHDREMEKSVVTVEELLYNFVVYRVLQRSLTNLKEYSNLYRGHI